MFLKLAPDVRRFKENQSPMIRYLAHMKLVHWGVRIWALMLESLARVLKLDPCMKSTERL